MRVYLLRIRNTAVTSAVVLLLVFASSGVCDDYTQTSQVGNATVTFVGPNTAQGKQDVDNIKKAFDDAVKRSPDMAAKVKDAASKFDNKLTINVKRKSQEVTGGEREPGKNIVNIDPYDIEKVKDHLESEKKDNAKAAKDVATVADNFLVFVLAHEIDHARDGKETNSRKQTHKDPSSPGPGKSSGVGPPDKDANQVMKDLKTGVTRTSYANSEIIDAGPPVATVPTSTFEVMTDKAQKVTLNLMDWSYFTTTEVKDKFAPTPEFSVNPSILQSIHSAPCMHQPPPQGECCYPLPVLDDWDLDGVPNGVDNAPNFADPQQADFDGDGIGAGVDPDDDGYVPQRSG